jgi:non-haem Fe2+, alpha-ketoglutarate-dependent halogenase
MVNEILEDQLTKEAAFFEENGFLGPIKLYEPEEAKDILHRIRTKNNDRSKILFNNDVNYDRHFDIPELANHICNPKIIQRLQRIIGNDIFCWRTEFFPKFPGDAGTEWHQVANYQYATGIPMIQPTIENENIPIDLTVWTAFTDATKETACMKFLPGTHKKLYYDESKAVTKGRGENYKSVKSGTLFFGYDFNDFKKDPNWEPDEDKAVAVEMKPGECVIFSAKCIHASYPNTSKKATRFAITARYVASHVRVYPNQNHFVAHGGEFDLKNYGVILVSGKDDFKHNQVRDKDNHGCLFPTELTI